MTKIFPVLLAGGSGTRLWPLSRKSYPKQFSKIAGDTTLFQASAKRLTSSDILEFASHITVTNSDFRFIVEEQLKEIHADCGSILIEPEAKNTAAAILAASLFAHSKDNAAVLLVAPSDHIITDIPYFHSVIEKGLAYTQRGQLVTFGVKPTKPETGYGYLELSSKTLDVEGTSKIINFIEKPELGDAVKMFSDSNFLWNAGIFLFRAEDMIDAFKLYSKDVLELVLLAIRDAKKDLGFLRLDPEAWRKLEDISIDYAIMEKAKNIVAVPFNSKWSDLGNWEAVWNEGEQDLSGNVLSENAFSIECNDSLLRTEDVNQKLVGIGLDNIIAVAMADAVLVADKRRSQDVKKAVSQLKIEHAEQAEIFPRDHRPWGWFDRLVIGNGFQVKRIFVKPGGVLSLQSHQHRSEHWIVVEGSAKVTIDDVVKTVNGGQSVYIPVGALHRMENPYENPMVLIEVQIGAYLGEDDIVRYEDIYARE